MSKAATKASPAESPRVTLEYIGPSGQMATDEETGTWVELVAGRRYQMSAALATYRAEHDVHHWKRPDLPQAPIAAKE